MECDGTVMDGNKRCNGCIHPLTLRRQRYRRCDATTLSRWLPTQRWQRWAMTVTLHWLLSHQRNDDTTPRMVESDPPLDEASALSDPARYPEVPLTRPLPEGGLPDPLPGTPWRGPPGPPWGTPPGGPPQKGGPGGGPGGVPGGGPRGGPRGAPRGPPGPAGPGAPRAPSRALFPDPGIFAVLGQYIYKNRL